MKKEKSDMQIEFEHSCNMARLRAVFWFVALVALTLMAVFAVASFCH